MGQGGRCQRCEELEAEVAVLKGELGLTLNAAQIQWIRTLGLSKGQARLVCALYDSGGRPLSFYALELVTRGEPYDSNALQSFVAQIRRRLGPDFVETVKGFGYSLPAASRNRILAILNLAEAA